MGEDRSDRFTWNEGDLVFLKKPPRSRACTSSGLLGQAVGDALGVPVEFQLRDSLSRRPVTTMIGYGTHNQPPGTWSDDASLTLCAAESLINGFDPDDIGRLLVRWADQGYWTARGRVFDVGSVTLSAISRLRIGVPASRSGCASERDNGNGSLMRVLPVAVYFASSPEEKMLDALHMASAITHAHPRSMIACGLYGLLVRGLVHGLTPTEAYAQACIGGRSAYSIGGAGAESISQVVAASSQPGQPAPQQEVHYFDRFLSGDLASAAKDSVESGGYVVHTLEASVWCLLTTRDFASAVIKAVNLGGDTDTTGAVTGGLADLYYGDEAIPRDWLDALARCKDIEDLAKRFSEMVTG